MGDSELAPPGCHMYSLPSHAMDAIDSTRSTEDGYGRCVDIDFRAEVQLFGGWQSYLMLKKFMDKCLEVWYFDILCDVRWQCFPIYIVRQISVEKLIGFG